MSKRSRSHAHEAEEDDDDEEEETEMRVLSDEDLDSKCQILAFHSTRLNIHALLHLKVYYDANSCCGLKKYQSIMTRRQELGAQLLSAARLSCKEIDNVFNETPSGLTDACSRLRPTFLSFEYLRFYLTFFQSLSCEGSSCRDDVEVIQKTLFRALNARDTRKGVSGKGARSPKENSNKKRRLKRLQSKDKLEVLPLPTKTENLESANENPAFSEQQVHVFNTEDTTLNSYLGFLLADEHVAPPTPNKQPSLFPKVKSSLRSLKCKEELK